MVKVIDKGFESPDSDLFSRSYYLFSKSRSQQSTESSPEGRSEQSQTEADASTSPEVTSEAAPAGQLSNPVKGKPPAGK